MQDTILGNHSLQDLVLAGIKWELSETSSPLRKEGEERADKSARKDETPEIPIPAPAVKPQNIACHPELQRRVVPPTRPVEISAALLDAVNCANGACDAGSLCAAICGFDHPLRAFANTVAPAFAIHLRQNSGGQESPADKNLIIITDMPTSDDDACGKIMAGGAGELLDKMLSAIGMARESVSIVPLVFWRTPGGRTPAREEMDLCRPFVMQAIKIACGVTGDRKQVTGVNPIVLTLGTLAAAEIANAKLPADHGKEFPVTCHLSPVTVIPIWHPNYLLLKPDAKKDVWAALQKVLQIMQ